MSDLIESDRTLRDAKKQWKPLFDLFLDHDTKVNAFVEALAPEDRAQLVEDSDLFGQTNCGWYEYEAMHKSAAAAKWRIRRDELEAAVVAP